MSLQSASDASAPGHRAHSSRSYCEAVLAVARQAADTQQGAILRAAALVSDALASGRSFWAFGSGHSHALVEEIYGRAGGLTLVKPILEPSLMLHEGLAKSSTFERLSGLATALLEVHPVAGGDVVLVVSNSGRNAVPVELAEQARGRGASVVALTSTAHSESVASRAPSGRRLFEVAHVVIDNCGVPGDAILPYDPHPIGPTSTVVGAMLVQALMVEVTIELRRRGVGAPTLLSLNV